MSTQAFKREDIRVFIGSSSESKEIAQYVQLVLDDFCETAVWDQNVFGLSKHTLGELLRATKEHDFAILVYAPDDIVRKRNTQKSAPRDNVIFESGLFMGAIGPDRTFLLCPEDKLSLPTDLAGITMAPFHRNRKDRNLQSAVTPAVVRIRDRMKQLGPNRSRVNESSGMDIAFRHQADAVASLARNIAGMQVVSKNSDALRRWTKNVLRMLQDSFAVRKEDTYTAWLRPVHSRDTLEVFLHSNLVKVGSHHPFKLGEGLVGKVWQHGKTAAVSPMRNHEWWVLREGCENVSYICACIGDPKSDMGVLAVGSDSGFDIQPGDEERVAAYAALLEIAAKGLTISHKSKRT